MESLSAVVIGAIVTILTALFGYLKLRDSTRFSGIEERMKLAQEAALRCQEAARKQEQRVHELETEVEKLNYLLEVERNTSLELRHQLDDIGLTIQSLRMQGVKAVITLDEHGLVLEWSPAASVMFGYAEDEMIGKAPNALVPAAMRERHSLMLDEVLRGRNCRSTPLVAVACNRRGQDVPVVIHLSAWSDEQRRRRVTAEIAFQPMAISLPPEMPKETQQ